MSNFMKSGLRQMKVAEDKKVKKRKRIEYTNFKQPKLLC